MNPIRPIPTVDRPAARTRALATRGLHAAGALLIAVATLGPPPATLAQALDPQFANTGFLRLTRPAGLDYTEDVAIDSQGRRVVAFSQGDDTDTETKQAWLMRFTADGQTDLSFGVFGVTGVDSPRAEIDLPLRLAIDSQDRPVVGYTMFDSSSTEPNRDWFVQRFTTAGASDIGMQVTPSGSGGRDELGAMAFADDGDLILGGTTYLSATDTDFVFAVVEDDGFGGLQVDASFGHPTIHFDLGGAASFRIDVLHDLIMQGDAITAVGVAVGDSGVTRMAAARMFKASQTLDHTFGTGGKATYANQPLLEAPWDHNVAFAVDAVPSGGYVLGGWGNPTDGTFDDRILALRIDLSGAIVLGTWGSNGWFSTKVPYPGTLSSGDSVARDLYVGPQGETLLVGEVVHPTLPQRLGAVVALDLFGAPDTDFSGDGIHTYGFEPGDEPTNTYFLAVAPDGPRALLGGTTTRVQDGETANDLDMVVAMIYTGGAIFTNGFESGSTNAWQ